MKKAFLLATILFISVISTACINNFAVQELNNKAKDFMDKGDYTSAIERLKSSVDLDGNVFETQYNLAVAYTKAEDYENAINAYSQALKLKPEFADAYYSLAVCQENLAKDIVAKDIVVNDDGTLQKAVENQDIHLSDKAKLMISELFTNAISNYEIYIEKAPSADDKNEVKENIEVLKNMMKEYVK